VVQRVGSNIPFLACSNAPHTMQLVQYRLKTRQDRAIKLNRERALQTRLMLRLLEQILQLEEFDLQMQLPIRERSDCGATTSDGDMFPYIAINSSTELFSFLGSNDVSSLGSSGSAMSIGFSGENELDATRRVYSQPIFKQNLCATLECQH
jgi:hypothetical protein